MKSFSNDIPTKASTVTPEQVEARFREYARRVQKAFMCHAILCGTLFLVNLAFAFVLFKSIHH